jgi:hypothetical protein
MLFCGQCGLRLNPGDKQCPRCGTPVESGAAALEDNTPPDAPTVASASLLGQMQTQTPVNPDRAGDPQKLILRPDQDVASYETQDAYEATRRVQSQEQGYTGTPSNPALDPSHPADLPTRYAQNREQYPSQQDMYAEYPQNGGNYAPPGTSHPGFAQQGMGYQPSPAQQAQATTNARGRTASLLIILLGLFLILIAMALFILERNNVFGSGNSGSLTTVSGTGALTPEQQGQALIQQYYDDINTKKFPAASLLWQENQRPDLPTFENGFKNTLHDAVTFNTVMAQGDGTLKVSVTINATEKANTGNSINSVYTGYYIVGSQNGTWQLLQGSLNRA